MDTRRSIAHGVRLAAAAVVLAWSGAAAAQAADAHRLAPNGQTPRMNYLHYCAGCHLPDGSGKPDKGIPNMRG
ncbi:MAG TPA: hypothetical protein PLG77_17360, partial [Burkholderiaceae bacterium]|nr:hypothetical protein [Burkholderiaceae bacterium]